MAQITYPSDREQISADDLAPKRLAIFGNGKATQVVMKMSNEKGPGTYLYIINIENGIGGYREYSTFTYPPVGTLITLNIKKDY